MKYCYALGAVLLTSLSPMVSAAVSEQDLAEIRAQFAALAERLSALEAENAELRQISAQNIKEQAINREQVAALGAGKKSASWADSVKLKGDFRYRYESINEENKSTRERNRIRARAAIVAKVEDNLEVGLGFASGGDDPVSTNQTLGGGGSTKDLRLDLAYFNWAATEDVNLIAGKFKNIYYRPQKHGLIWDGDYNPEGFALAWTPGSFFVNAGGTWLESDSKGDNDELAFGAQAGFKGAVGDANVVAGVGYRQLDTVGKSPFHGDADDFFGNSFACGDPVTGTSCSYQYDYHTVQGFADISMSIADMPVSLFGDYVHNTAAGEFDTGYAVGIKLGKTKGAATWDFSYIWQDLEADATLGLLTDSNFGDGGTDGKGHVLKGGYGVTKKWTLGVIYFNNEVKGNRGNPHNYHRIMLDTQFKY